MNIYSLLWEIPEEILNIYSLNIYSLLWEIPEERRNVVPTLVEFQSRQWSIFSFYGASPVERV